MFAQRIHRMIKLGLSIEEDTENQEKIENIPSLVNEEDDMEAVD